MSFQETFDIDYYCYCYCYFTFTDCRQKKVSHHLKKKSKLIKISLKRGKVIYLYESVNIIFVLYLKFYQNFKNYHARRLKADSRFGWPDSF